LGDVPAAQRLRDRALEQGRVPLPVNSTLAAWLGAAEGSDEEFVERAWRLVLRREVEPEARERTLLRLRAGELSRAALLGDLAASEEFERVRLLDDAVAAAAGARRAPRSGSSSASRRSSTSDSTTPSTASRRSATSWVTSGRYRSCDGCWRVAAGYS